MMRKNFLLGKGERLTEDLTVKPGWGGPKKQPYTFDDAHERLMPMLSRSVSNVYGLPADACPQDQAILSLILHPEYIAKSYFPNKLLNAVGMTVVGSRPRKVTPEKYSQGRDIGESVTTELFTLCTRSAMRNWSENFPSWSEFNYSANDLIAIEEISVPIPLDKIKGTFSDSGTIPLEVVLYASELQARERVLKEFANFLDSRNLHGRFGKCFFAKGLCFLQISAPTERVEEIATFSIVRAIRPMPKLRTLKPVTRSTNLRNAPLQLPDEHPISRDVRVAIFDCGIPENHPLSRPKFLC